MTAQKTLTRPTSAGDLKPGMYVLTLGPVDFPAPAKVTRVERLNSFFVRVTVGEDISVAFAVPRRAPIVLPQEEGCSA